MFGVPVRWCKSKCAGTRCDGGSQYNAQKRIYALQVAINLAGYGDIVNGTVCHCGAAIDLHNGEVDRTEEGCYRPGYVVMTCESCNNDRTHVRGFDSEGFRDAVISASIGVEIWSVTEASRFFKAGRNVGATVRNSRFYMG